MFSVNGSVRQEYGREGVAPTHRKVLLQTRASPEALFDCQNYQTLPYLSWPPTHVVPPDYKLFGPLGASPR